MKHILWKEILVVALCCVCSFADAKCGLSYTGAQGTIQSEGFDDPGHYPNGSDCSYTIYASHGNKILLEFDEFDLEQSNNCSKDYLEVYETGIRSIVRRCGNDTRPYFSETDVILLTFVSDSSNNRKGFRIQYKTCGGDFRKGYKYDMISPSYGISQYPNNSRCQYEVEGIRNFQFLLVFNVFSLENSTSCQNDKLSFYNGYVSTSTFIAKRCGKDRASRASLVMPSTIIRLTAVFLTNSHISGVGFNVSVYPCYRLLTADAGEISSPNFPVCGYRVFCLYEIKLPIGSKLKLKFEDVSSHGDGYLKIKNNRTSSDIIFKNVANKSDVESREYGNQLYLELKCGLASRSKVNGFKLSYYDNQGSCSKYKPCYNGGNCTDTDTKSGTYSCTCTPDYEGMDCSKKISSCESSPCRHGGICEDIPSRNNLPPTFRCTCVGDYTGKSCETLMGSCAKYSPCQNNGQCRDVNKATGTYHCTCPLDFEGKNCSQLIEPCKSSPCLHGGACTNIRSRNNNPPTFSCACTEEYKGRTCDHFIDGCIEYRNDSRWQRSIGYKDSTTFCDGSLQFSWYRFVSKAGPDMPTICPIRNSCGTTGSIWINGTVDLQTGSEVDMTACARNSNSCCSASWDVRVKKCQGFSGTTFTVYRLRTPPSCPMAYCAGTELPCPTNYNSVNGFTPNCTETHPQIMENPRVYPDVEDHRLVFKCEFKSNTKEDVARFHVSWFEEFPLKQLNKIDILKGTERVAKLQIPLNSSRDASQFRLGKTIFCKVYSWYEDRPYGRVNGPLKESNHYFAGIKVEPSQTHYIMHETSHPLRFTVKVTVPIVCRASNDCNVAVRIKQDNSEIYLSLCSMRFHNRTTSNVFDLAVKRDFIYGRNKQTRVKLQVQNQTDPIDFIDHHDIPEIVITIIEEISHYHCSSTTDPYIKPVSGSGYFQGGAGTHVLARDATRKFEVQSRTFSCGGLGTCNCGIAAREGDDVVVVDFCSGGPMSARFASQREPAFGTTLHMGSNGRDFQVNFPSGASIMATHNGRWFNVNLYIPKEVYPAFAGACRSSRSWVAVGQNLFYYYDGVKACRKETMKRYCICGGVSVTGYKEDCTIKTLINRKKYYDSLGKSILLLHPTAKLCNTKVEGLHITLPEPEPPVVIPTEPQPTLSPGPTPTWPATTGKNESDIRAYCENAIRNSAVGRACASISNFPFHLYIEQCIVNVQLSGTFDYTLSTIEAMQRECGDIFHGNESRCISLANNTGCPPREFNDTLCPGLCSGNGNCVEAKCVCYENYTSIDCSIDKRKGPTLLWIRYGSICDLRTRPNCHLVRIVGSNFMVATKSACRSTKLKVHASGHSPTSEQNLHRVNLISFSEVLCTTSSLSSSHAAYSIDVTNDGSIFSSTGLPYVIYDSKCMNCSHGSSSPTVCSIKKNTCNIDGSCYLLGETSKSDPYAICNPSLNQTAFTKDHFPKIINGPELSVFVKNKRLTFGCEFQTENNESRARFQVTWFELSPLKQINRTHVLKGFERSAKIFSDDLFTGKSLFSLGATIFCRVRSWYINTSVSHIPGPYHDSNRYFAGIKVEPNRQIHVVSESRSTMKLTVSATVPIVCNTSDSCRILVQLTTDNSEILLSACMLEFKPGAANRSHIVHVFAKRDFILDGSHIVKLRLNISRKGIPIGWNNHRAIPDVLIKTNDVDTRICQSTGDPHITTYDGLYFDHYKVGTYLLAKSNCRKFEVHVRTHKCNAVSCNCGVAAREDNDVIVVDFCKGAIQTARFASKGIPANGTKLLRDRIGRNFIISFPSGSSVRVSVHPYGQSYYANIVVHVPGDDYQCTTGLCGTFDSNQATDMTDSLGRTHNYLQYLPASAKFTESYRLDSTNHLFNYKDVGNGGNPSDEPSVSFCSCASVRTSDVVCNYKASSQRHVNKVKDWVELVPSNGNNAHKGDPNTVVVLPPNEDDANYKFEPEKPTEIVPEWPTPSGRTKLEVEAYCNDKIRNSASGKICAIIPSFPFHQFVQQCVTDIQVTDTEDFTRSAIQSMQFACEEIFKKNMSYWKQNLNNNGTLQPPPIFDERCPGLCSSNGVCVNSTCKCNDPYVGDDCSINKNIPPEIDSVGINGLCDVRKSSSCHIVKIRGRGFLENSKLACRTAKLKTSEKFIANTDKKRSHRASLLSFKEIACDIGSHSVTTDKRSDRFPSDGYMIEVTNDGVTFSKTQATYVIYDSKCMECNGKDSSCKQKEKTCIIYGQCNLHGESTGNLKCYPKAKVGASKAATSSERETLIAVGCFIGVVLILAIISLVGIRRKQKEDEAKSEIESETVAALELGRINLSLFGDYEEPEDEKKCKDTEEVLCSTLNDNEDCNESEEKEDEEAGKSECKPGKNCKEEDEEERYVKVFGAGLQREDEEEPVVKNAEIVVHNYLADGDCAEVNMKRPVDIMESNKDEDCGSEEVAVNGDEAKEKDECSSSKGVTAEDVKPDPGVKSEPLYENLAGEEDFNVGISNLSYEESVIGHDSRA